MNVRKLTAADLVWECESPHPHYCCGAGSYQRNMTVDPFPGYAHDVELVKDLVAECCEAFPLADRAELCILEHEFTGRTNGLSFEDSIWRREDGSDWSFKVPCTCGKPDCKKVNDVHAQGHTIVLCGKRIPIMRPTTRYLVAHEYGHCAFNRINRLLGKDHSGGTLEAEYMKLRGCDVPGPKSGGTRWHRLASEVIANDFRTLVMKREVEFWPHEVPQLNGDSPIAAWWMTMMDKARQPWPAPEQQTSAPEST